MRLLLDTHCWLWMVSQPERLSRSVRAVLESPGHQLLLSAASSWEIAVKSALRKLSLPRAATEFVPEMMERTGVRGLAVEHVHALAVSSLPHHHGDPFDRLLIAQATLERLTIVTADPVFARYDVEIIDPS